MTTTRRARNRFRRSPGSFPAGAAPTRARNADRTLLDVLEQRGRDADRVIDRLLAAIERAPNLPVR